MTREELIRAGAINSSLTQVERLIAELRKVKEGKGPLRITISRVPDLYIKATFTAVITESAEYGEGIIDGFLSSAVAAQSQLAKGLKESLDQQGAIMLTEDEKRSVVDMIARTSDDWQFAGSEHLRAALIKLSAQSKVTETAQP